MQSNPGEKDHTNGQLTETEVFEQSVTRAHVEMYIHRCTYMNMYTDTRNHIGMQSVKFSALSIIITHVYPTQNTRTYSITHRCCVHLGYITHVHVPVHIQRYFKYDMQIVYLCRVGCLIHIGR